MEACQKLESLDLDGTKVTGEGFSHLLKLPNLRLLSLGAYENGAPVDDRGMELIGQMSQLTYLSLNGTKVTDEGLKHVSGLKNLESLSLDYTQVTEEGLASLASLEKLRSLRLQGFARGGLRNLGDRVAEHLSKVPNLELVVGRWSLTQQGFEHLGRMKKIKSLTFDGNVSDDQMNRISLLASLEELNLYSCQVTDVGIAKIVNLPNLNSISIHESKVTGTCLQTLQRIDNLKRLRISFEAFGPENHWTFLGELRGLEALDIGAPEFGKTACSALAKLARLKELEVSHPTVGSDFLEAVAGMKNLESLRFVASDVGSESWQKLARLNNLEYLDFRGDITNDQLMLFADLPSLRIFQNHSEKLTLQGIEEFAKKSKSLQNFLHPLTRKDRNATN